jgi:hypothetical protein
MAEKTSKATKQLQRERSRTKAAKAETDKVRAEAKKQLEQGTRADESCAR